MKRIGVTFFLTVLLVSLNTKAAPICSDGWKLVWSDEFTQPGHPDPARWNYEEGFVRNGEPQYYTKGRLQNVRQENGNLVLEVRKEIFPNAHISPPTEDGSQSGNPIAHYTSGSITTEGKEHWLYGRFEIRAKLPTGVGAWPAFWTLGESRGTVSWPECGELDIMEYWARHPDMVTSSVHYAENGIHRHLMGKVFSKTPLSDFHRYAVEWYPDRLDYFFDDKKFFSVPMSEIHDDGLRSFHKPHYILLSLALDRGHNWIDDAALPQQFLINYIRVYQKPGAGF